MSCVGLTSKRAAGDLDTRSRPVRSSVWFPAPELQRSRPWRVTAAPVGVLLTRLWSASLGDYVFPTLADVYPQDERVAREDAAFEYRQRDEPNRGVPGLHGCQ